EFVGDHPLRTILLIRLLPLGSNLATNLAAGISRMGTRPFAAGSALGYLPQTLVFALIGSGIAVDPLWRIGTGILLFLLSGLLGLSLYRHFRLRKSARRTDFDLEPAGK
ncbi:MAG TPA: VTT domain-containing protein, partial [Gammaproteobacteria bacterium]|nr:VTT domain-containing protein [Gammaproteobacteria bacterium]